MNKLFDELSKQLNKAGYITCQRQIIDTSNVLAPVQRNTRDENGQIKQGDVPQDWEENKRCQKDVDAHWTKKHGKSHYGYKNHINVDNKISGR